MYAAVMVGQGVAPVLMDVLYDKMGSYQLAINLMEAIFVAGALALTTMRPYEYTLCARDSGSRVAREVLANEI